MSTDMQDLSNEFSHPAPLVDKTILVEQFLPFVHSIARQVRKSLPTRIGLEDLVSYGMTGLLEAAERYDPKQGANFTTFSYYRVRGAIYDGLRKMGWVSRSEYQKIRFGEQATAYLENRASRQMSANQSQKSPSDHVEDLADQVNQLITIFVTSLEGLQEAQFEDKKQIPQDEQCQNNQMQQCVRQAIDALQEEDRLLIQLYYFQNLNLEQIGQKLGLSKSWICRKHAQAIEKLSTLLSALIEEKAVLTKKNAQNKSKRVIKTDRVSKHETFDGP